MDFQVPH